MIPVVWLTYTDNEDPRDKWDAGLLEHLFAGTAWNPVGGHQYEHWRCRGNLDELAGRGAVVVFPAGIHAEQYDRLNADLARLPWVLLILTADEGSLFEAKHVHHPNLILWVMTPRPGVTYPVGTRFIGEGYAADTPTVLAHSDHDDRYGVFFAGQTTHLRRRQMVTALVDVIGQVIETEGFAQGLDRHHYLHELAQARVAPAPSGPVTPDSFRLYEALEAGCLPIADGACPAYTEPGYWDMVAPGHPFPVITDWVTEGADTVHTALNDWPGNANHASAWWQAHKRTIAYWLVDDLTDLGAPTGHTPGLRDDITVLVCTSPIPSHPSTAMIEETIASIRERLPDSEIIIGIDGIRPEQEEYRPAYDEFTHRLLWLCNHEWDNVLPVVFDGHRHQSGMAVATIGMVRTPYVFYVEGDLPICGHIPFAGFIDCLADGTADLIRLTLNTDLEPSHMHLMLDAETVHGVPMQKTVQWSQQPHLATTTYYRDILDRWFAEGEATYIEWRMHSVCAGQWFKDGPLAWFRNRIWIYTPPGNMCRVRHLDGRAGDPVYDT